MIETRLLQYFLAIAREQSITRAAEALHVTQPTLSKQMMELEAQLGKQLFIRGRKNIRLTDEGAYLRARAQEIINLMEHTEDVLTGDAQEIAGDVYLGCGETVLMERITTVFLNIRQAHPQIKFHLYSGAADSVLARLEKGLLDVCLLIGPLQQEKYDYLPLGVYDRFGLLVPASCELAKKTSLAVEEIGNLPLVFPNQSEVLRSSFSRLVTQLHPTNIVASYELLYNATFLVTQGMGYALCLDGLIDPVNSRGLKFIPLVPEIRAESVLVVKKYQTFSPAAKLFLSEMRNAFT